MSGADDMVFRVMGAFVNVDKLVGPDFEKARASMSTLAEASAKQAAETAAVIPVPMDSAKKTVNGCVESRSRGIAP